MNWFSECPDCDYVTPSKLGLAVHRKKVHNWEKPKKLQ